MSRMLTGKKNSDVQKAIFSRENFFFLRKTKSIVVFSVKSRQNHLFTFPCFNLTRKNAFVIKSSKGQNGKIKSVCVLIQFYGGPFSSFLMLYAHVTRLKLISVLTLSSFFSGAKFPVHTRNFAAVIAVPPFTI